VPLAHDELTEIGYEEFIDVIGPILTDKSIGKVGHNIKYDYVVMKQFGIDVTPIAFDTMVAAFLISPIGRAQTLSQLAYEELGISMIDIEELIGKKGKNQLTFNKIAIKEAGQYAAEDADITLRLYNKLKSELDKIGELTKLAKQMEWPLIEVLGDMEYKGVELDVEFLNKLSDKYSTIIEGLQTKIWKIAGGQFNISSPAQLQKILFEKLKIDSTGLKKTKTGISTAASELEKLRGKHEIVDMMFEYRELTKLTTTYVDALPKLVKPDGRIHTSYNQTIAQTGRLSSTNPNLQNIPTRTEAGREIRKAFVAPKGRVFISADYSQIELRLAAALAKDEPMIKAFKSGADIHTATAAEMFGVKQSEVTKDQRYGAKTINFGVLYGMNPHGLSVATGFDYDKAREFIDRYFSLRKGVADYIASVKKFAHDNNYTETIFGRRRPCPDVRSSNFIIRAAAERAAVNMPLQGTAADMMKIAMINIHKKLPKDADLILQIHDELIVECSQEDAKKVGKIVKDEMEKVHKFDVPIEVEVHHGTSWGSLK
jgi:DNA polymerase-1